MIFHDTVVDVRPGTRTDRGGNTVEDWSNPTRTTIEQVSVQPTDQAETVTAQRSAAVSGWQVISAPGTDPDVRAGDRIEWQGMTLEVIGEVARWDPDGPTHHVEFTMSRATG